MPFPLNALPAWLRAMVEAVSASAQAQVDMVAAAAVGVVSAAVGRKGWVTLGRRRFPLHVWIMIVGESGDGKSTVINDLGAPLQDVQALPDRGAPVPRPGRSVYDWLRNPNPWGNVEPARLDDAVDVVRQALAGSTGLHLLLDDITPTTLIDALGSNATGSALISPEGGFESWLTEGGAVASQNAATLNRTWEGEPFTRRRQDRTVRVERPALTLLVGVQPDIFRTFAGNRALLSRGFTLRFLFMRSVARRRVYPAPEIPVEVRAAFDSGIYRLVALPGWPPRDPMRIPISDDAAQMNSAFMNRLEERIQVGGDLHHGRGYGRRFGSNLPRLAGLLHLARNAPVRGDAVVELPIDEGAMAAAVEIATYFLEEGVAALNEREDAVAGVQLVDAVERLLRDPAAWIGTPDELVAALERVVPPGERSGWPRGTNNMMRALRARRVDLAARGISFPEENRTSAVRIVTLSRREGPPNR